METELKTIDTIRRPVRGAQAPPRTRKQPTHATSSSQVALPPSAIVYCEGNFAKIDGKTANGLVRHSEAYRIRSVIDSTQSGRDSGFVLDDLMNDIPIFG